MATYKYTPLQPGQIRLLHLQIDNAETVSCTLENVDIDRTPPYEALSYRWQHPEPANIIVDGYLVPIGRSLFHVLRDVRRATQLATPSPPQMRTLWADGVCIDQDNVTEKNAQIPLMDRIYRKASRVITYIGEADETTPSAIALARDLVALARATQKPPDPAKADELYARQYRQLGIPPHDKPHPDKRIRTLQSMLYAPWSRRLWIVQESLLNENGMVMMCGEHEMEWTLLYNLSTALLRGHIPRLMYFGWLANPDPHAGSGTTIRTMAWLRSSFREQTILTLMLSMRHMLCFEPRDRVYGLYGLFRVMGITSAPDVDYRKTVAEVYTDAARFLLAQATGLKLFTVVFFEPQVQRLPSWVPDWTTECRLIFRLSHEQEYKASGSTPMFLEMDTATRQTIAISGVIVDHVSYVSSEVLTSMYSPTKPEKCSQFLNDNLTRIRESKKYQGLDAVEVLWRTITTDVFAVRPPRKGLPDAARTSLGRILYNMNIVNKPEDRILVPGVENVGDGIGEDVQDLISRAAEKALCMTDGGYCGLVPPRSRAGDLVVVVRGGTVPLVLRSNIEGMYSLIGEAYVHGLMKGEVMQDDGVSFGEEYIERRFSIV